MSIKTPNKRLQVIARCALCDKVIWNNERWTALHGVFMCGDEEITKIAFALEEKLLAEGKIRLRFNIKTPP